MSLIPVYSNTFSGPDQNPIDPANFTTVPGFSPLQILGGHCVPTGTSDSGSFLSGVSVSNDQAAEFKLTEFDDSSNPSLDLFLRSTISGNGYAMELAGNGTGLGYTLSIFLFVNGVVNSTLFQNSSFTASVGDVFRFSAIGSVLTILQNGNQVAQATNSQYSSGSVMLIMSTFNLSNPVGINNFIVFNSVSSPTTDTIGIGKFSGANFSQVFSSFGQDVVQIVNEGGNVIWNLTSAGVANFNPTSPTQKALFTYFGNSFSQAFSNLYNLDVLQVVSEGGKVVFNVDYQGNATTH